MIFYSIGEGISKVKRIWKPPGKMKMTYFVEGIQGILRQHGRPGSMIKAMRSGFRCSVNILTTVLMQSELALKAKTA